MNLPAGSRCPACPLSLPLSLLAAFLPLLCPGAATAQVPLRPQPTAAPTADAIVPLDGWLTSPTLWQTTPDRFPAWRAIGFRWVSNARDAARAANPALRLGFLPVSEVIARFSPANAAVPVSSPGIAAAPATLAATGGSTQLSGVQVSIYNRGDAGSVDQKKFATMVEQARDALDALTGVRAVERGVDYGSAVQSRGLVWVTPASRFLFEWSETPENKVQGIEYRAEFIRLKVTPEQGGPKTVLEQMRAAASPAASTTRTTTVRASDLPARVVKDADGGEWLPKIPMVNQGEKGYCVTAATERVLRYYGADADQNELAQIANTTAGGGTSNEAMVAALKKLASRYRVSVITEYDLTYPDFVSEINDYNRAARNAPKSAAVSLIDTRTPPVSVDVVFNQMNGEVLRDARTKLNPAPMTRFEQNIENHISRGIPLLWSVYLGLLPEERLSPQARGGHMRLIIGYDAKTKVVYYSDTWGSGHELKKMPLANAWTITDGLFTLEPS